MATVTAKIKAWISPNSTLSPADLRSPECIKELSYFVVDLSKHGWTLAGEAEITVHMVDEKTLIDNKVEALREEAKAIRAEATAKATFLEGQIQSLLCIENNPAVPA